MARPPRYTPPNPEEYDPYHEANLGNRNSLKSDERIPSANRQKVGTDSFQPFNPQRQDTSIFGHPEAAGIYTGGYDNTDPYLESTPERRDYNFVSAEEVRRRSKGGDW